MLIETTRLPFVDVSFAAGFSSVRQFNETIRTTYGRTPSELRKKASLRKQTLLPPDELLVRLAFREPLDWAGILTFLKARAISGVEEVVADTYRRTLRLPHGWGVAELRPAARYIECRLRLSNLRDLGPAVQRCRRLLDLDSDPAAIDGQLAADSHLRGLVRAAPGRRVPGTVDGNELALRAVLGQQVSVPAARTTLGKIVNILGEPLPVGGGLTQLFPDAESFAEADLQALPGPHRRRETLRLLARELAGGELVLDPSSDRDEVRSRLLAVRGIGGWTADYIAMRALGDPDAFLPSDLGVRRALEMIQMPLKHSDIAAIAKRWRPWRAYAVQHLWASRDASGLARPAPG
jgi:AraC family transcriptional regulator, regulatory protein of adaptative response / DNA-3-methyladenine glycosylase II